MFSTTANQLYVKFSNGLFLSKDNGNFFKSIGLYISNLGAWVSNNQVLYTWSKYYYKSTDFGSTWTAILEGGQNNSNSLFISQQNSNRLFAVYHWKKIAVSNDGGWNWSTILIPNLAFVESIYVNKTNENIMFARCDGTYVKSTNGGETWSSMNVPTNEDGNFLRLSTSDINTLFLISKSPSPGKIYKSTNMGANWNILSIPLGSNENINDLQILNSNRLLLSARSFFISDNQGNTWSKVYNYTESIYTTDIFFNPNNSSTFFSHTTIYDKLVGSNNGGTAWWNSNQGLPSTLHYIHMGSLSSQGNLLVAADSNLYYGTPVISIKPINVNVPKNTKLVNNYPNPFNPSTKIKFDVAQEMNNSGRNVNLAVYDVLGREITTLVNEDLKWGTYEAEWDASNQPGGIYFARLTAGEYRETIKMVLVK